MLQIQCRNWFICFVGKPGANLEFYTSDVFQKSEDRSLHYACVMLQKIKHDECYVLQTKESSS